MLISVGHVIRYTYGEPSKYAILALRLVPPSFDGHRVIDWAVTAPGMETSKPFRDGFGNVAHLATLTSEHRDFVIIAKGLVDVRDTSGIVKGLADWAPRRVFMRETPATATDQDVRAMVKASGARADVAGLHTLMHAVRETVEFEGGGPDSCGSAGDALRAKRGGRRDLVQIFIASARVLDMPARYVTGYRVPEDEGPTEALHAWADIWVDGLGWVGFDPVHCICPTDRYVRLASGLDAASATPVRVCRQGSAKEELDVIVEVQQQNVQQ